MLLKKPVLVATPPVASCVATAARVAVKARYLAAVYGISLGFTAHATPQVSIKRIEPFQIACKTLSDGANTTPIQLNYVFDGHKLARNIILNGPNAQSGSETYETESVGKVTIDNEAQSAAYSLRDLTLNGGPAGAHAEVNLYIWRGILNTAPKPIDTGIWLMESVAISDRDGFLEHTSSTTFLDCAIQ